RRDRMPVLLSRLRRIWLGCGAVWRLLNQAAMRSRWRAMSASQAFCCGAGQATCRCTAVAIAGSALRADARRQPEAGEVGGQEGGNFRDVSVPQGEDVEAAGKVGACGVVPQVGAERELAVGRGGQEPPACLQRAAEQ